VASPVLPCAQIDRSLDRRKIAGQAEPSQSERVYDGGAGSLRRRDMYRMLASLVGGVR
jgi:hypothetical protein